MTPNVTAGGIRATATMTPTRALDVPVVRERTAAAPEASAKIMLAKPILVRLIISALSWMSLNGMNSPAAIEINNVRPSPMMFVWMERVINFFSPSADPNARARFGPKSGAMTIAPMMTATSL